MKLEKKMKEWMKSKGEDSYCTIGLRKDGMWFAELCKDGTMDNWIDAIGITPEEAWNKAILEEEKEDAK